MHAKILVVASTENLSRLLEYTLEVDGYQVHITENGADALNRIQAEPPDLIILSTELPDIDGADVHRQLRHNPQTQNVPVLLFGAEPLVSSSDLHLQTGKDDYLTLPARLDELTTRVEALLVGAQSSAPKVKRARVLGFIGMKDRVGTTTVVLNVALSLIQRGHRVIAAEMRPYAGMFASQLKMTPRQTLADVLDMTADQLDQQMLASLLEEHPSGLRALFSPQTRKGYKGFQQAQIETVVNGLAGLTDYLILDLPQRLSPSNQTALGCCDFVVLVMEPDSRCLAAGQAVLQLLDMSKTADGRVGAVVVNRGKLEMSAFFAEALPEIRSKLNCGIVGVVPAASEACLAALESGSPLVLSQPHTVVAITLTELADRLAEEKITFL